MKYFAMTNVRWMGSLLAAVLLSSSVCAQSINGEQPRRPTPVISSGTEVVVGGAEPWINRSRGVELDVNVLREVADRPDERPRMSLNLFDDVALTVEVRDANVISPNRFTTTGVIPRVVGSSAIISVRNDAVYGVISVPQVGIFEIRHDEQGGHRVTQLDPALMAGCGVGANHAVSLPNGGMLAQGGAGDDPVVVDVMVVYTPAARAAAGGEAAMLAAIDTAMAQTANATINSDVNVQFNLVFTAEVDYEQTGNGDLETDLVRLREQGNGYLDEVHQWRVEVGADLVALIPSYTTSLYCGIAYLMDNPSPLFGEWAFSVTRLECIANLTFAHELGHNMGCHHDHATTGGTSGAFSYSHGHRFTGSSGTEWRTVMAYPPGVRITNFSNPDILHDGHPTGVPAGQPGEADNALTINSTAPIVSHFMTAGANACDWNDLDGGVDSAVWALTEYNGDLIAGGDFTTAGGTTAPRIARWDGDQWQFIGAANTTVRALQTYDGDLIAGGLFTIIGGQSVGRIARYNGSQWQPLGDGLSGGSNPRVFDMQVLGGNLYVAGTFLNAGEETVNRIARWDGSNWHSLGTGMNNNVYALTVHQGQLIAAGSFTNAGGVPVNRIARWDGSTWHPLGTGMNNIVFALESFQGDLFAGGEFTTAGGTSANHIARWDGSTWHPLANGLDDVVQTLAVHDENLFVGGSFASASSVTSSRLSRWNGSEWSTAGVGVNNVVRTVATFQDRLAVGGSFTVAGGVPISRIAIVDCEECALADINCDGVVDIDDLFILLSQWGDCDDVDDCSADLNDDNVVDIDDLFILLANWT